MMSSSSSVLYITEDIVGVMVSLLYNSFPSLIQTTYFPIMQQQKAKAPGIDCSIPGMC